MLAPQLIAICATEGQKDSVTANEARAKQWFEAAVALLPFASWGEAKAQKVRLLTSERCWLADSSAPSPQLRQRYSALLARVAAGPGGTGER